MDKLYISLLGQLRIADEADQLIEIEARKAQELLCFVLLFRERPHTREALAETLWPDQAAEQAKSYLRRTLWQLQSAFETCAGFRQNPLLLADPIWLRLNPRAQVWLDVARLEGAYALVRNVPGHELTVDQAARVESVTRLYRSDLLEGWYQDWCVFERERLQHIYLVLLDKLMRYCEAQERFETGIEYGLRILRQDRAREHTHRELMRLRYLTRDRTGALRQYERCVAALQDELGVEPTQKTRQLYAEIQHDAAARQAVPATSGQAGEAEWRQSLRELTALQDELAGLSARLDRQVQALHALLEESE